MGVASLLDDKNDAYFPKFVVLFGFILAFGSVMLLPLDVANDSQDALCVFDGTCGKNLDMEFFWTVVFWAILAMIAVVIPTTMFYYEADDFNMSSKFEKEFIIKSSLRLS